MKKWLLILSIAILTPAFSWSQKISAPRLAKQGEATQLIVNNQPFLVRGGELGNSTASSLEDLSSAFDKCQKIGLNTVLVPVYWELIEPAEGRFDFALVDGAIKLARSKNLKVIFLWFGVWKNSMSCYAPLWVKEDTKRFPRAVTKDGQRLEIVSAFEKANLDADRSAFSRLLTHIKEQDSEQQTVLMVQVENEIGMIIDARDYSPTATSLFNANIPKELADYLTQNRQQLHPILRQRWENNGAKVAGSWTEVFGQGLETDEIFMAYYYAQFVQELATTAKGIYPLPLYLNAALNSRGRKPGAYPAAGPLSHLIDIWRCKAPSIDILAPDIYDPGFTDWCKQYHINGNPLFIPEIRMNDANAAQVFYALGEHEAIGFSPFSIENLPKPESAPLAKSYNLISQLTPIILQKQGSNKLHGLWFDGQTKERILDWNGLTLTCRHDYTLGWDPAAKDGSTWPESGAIIIEMGKGEFIVAGTGVVISFKAAGSSSQNIGIGFIDEVKIANGKIIPTKRLNGDEDHQGRHLRIPVGTWSIQHIKLYEY